MALKSVPYVEYQGWRDYPTYIGYGETETVYHDFEFRKPLPLTWDEELIFNANVRVLDSYRGRSAARVTLVDDDRMARYSMTLTDFVEMVREGAFHGNKASVRLRHVKKGANYGVVFERIPK